MADVAYAFEHAPAPGTLVEVGPGLFWVRMPLPFALDHVNVWLLEEADGWTLIDTGMANEATKDLWRRILSGPARGRPIRRVVSTHFHPDHAGLAGWFEAEYGTSLLMSQGEWLMGRAMEASDTLGAQRAAFYAAHGLPRDRVERLIAGGNSYRTRTTPLPDRYGRLRDGDVVTLGGRPWRIIVGEGHAPEQACLYSPDLRVLISGDQVLPKITPNVSVHPFEPEANPLADFLASLSRFRELPDDVLVLPSHGFPFRMLHARLESLGRHHDDRLSDVADACAGSARTAFDLIPVLFRRPLDDHQIGFAMGEAIAHLNYLVSRGTIAVARPEDGRWLYHS